MENTLFSPNLISDRVTGSDALFGKERARNHLGELTENPVTTCHLSLIADAVILKADLERRGIKLGALKGVVVCEGEEIVIDRFAEQIVRLKPALLELLEHGEDETEALARFPAHLRATFPISDQIAIGRNLLLLDAGAEIEGETQ